MDSSSDDDWIIRQIAPDAPRKAKTASPGSDASSDFHTAAESPSKDSRKRPKAGTSPESTGHDAGQKARKLSKPGSGPGSADPPQESHEPGPEPSKTAPNASETRTVTASTESRRVPRKAPRIEEPEVAIPVIFLTQGERNHRILTESRRLAEEIEQEHERAQSRRQQYEAAKKRVLAELNDNGSSFVYTWKADQAVVDTYIRREQAHDVSATRARHLYVFGEAETGSKPPPAVALYFRFPHLLRDAPKAAAKLRRAGLGVADLVQHAMFTEDAAVLDAVLGVVERHSEPPATRPASPGRLLRMLGARDPGASARLKYVHYHRNTHLLVRKAAVAFQHCLGAVSDVRDAARWLFVCCCDFALNKQCASEMRRVLLGPVFSALAARDPDAVAAAFAAAFRLDTTLGDGPPHPQKAYELQYTFICNLLQCDLAGAARGAARQLAMGFVGGAAGSMSLTDVSNALLRMAGRLQRVDKDVVYRCFYELQVLAQCAVSAVAGGDFRDKRGLFRLHRTVPDCKEVFSAVLGQVSYAGAGVAEKPRVSTFLSESYRTLDYLGAVLDKMVVLAGRELFYETDV